MDGVSTLLFRFLLLPLVGALIGAAVKTWAQSRRFLSLLSVRDVTGWWTGQLRKGEQSKLVWVLFHRRTRWQFGYWLSPRIIIGSVWPDGKIYTRQGRLSNGQATSWAEGNDGDVQIDLRGGFYLSDHVMLDYRSRNPATRQIGTILLRLDSKGDTLSGHIIGYEDETFASNVTLTRNLPHSAPPASEPLVPIVGTITAIGFIAGLFALMIWSAEPDIKPVIGTTYMVSDRKMSMGDLLDGYTGRFVVAEGAVDLWELEKLQGRCLREFSLRSVKGKGRNIWLVMGCGGLPAKFRLEQLTPD
jgi:hypothetical protein